MNFQISERKGSLGSLDVAGLTANQMFMNVSHYWNRDEQLMIKLAIF